MKIITILIATLSLSLSSQLLIAHGEHGRSPEDAAEYRQAVMNSIAWNMGTMKAMIKGKLDGNVADFQQRAQTVKLLSQLALEGFKVGEAGDSAKAKIWDNWADFSQLMQALTDEASALETEAKNAKAIPELKAAFEKTSKACKSCHKPYKKR